MRRGCNLWRRYLHAKDFSLKVEPFWWQIYEDEGKRKKENHVAETASASASVQREAENELMNVVRRGRRERGERRKGWGKVVGFTPFLL